MLILSPSAVSTCLTPKDGENELSRVRATDWYQLALQHSLPHTHLPLYLQVDTPTLLNQDLPRVIPGLEEVKVESVKEETQTCGREFQDPPQLVQGRPVYVFAKSFYLGTEVPRHSAGCVGTYVRTSLFAMRPRKCCMLYTLNRVSNVFIACK